MNYGGVIKALSVGKSLNISIRLYVIARLDHCLQRYKAIQNVLKSVF